MLNEKDFEINNQTIIYENEIKIFRNANFQLVNDIIELSSKFQCLKTLLNNDEWSLFLIKKTEEGNKYILLFINI